MLDSTASALLTLPAGTILADRFTVERCLGYGSMSVVYLCRTLTTGEQVAVKVLQPSGGADESPSTYHTRFRVGVRIAQQVEHSRVAKVVELVDQPDLLACVMDYVEGPDLATKLQRERVPSISETLRVLREITEGVQAIHDNGIIHRDLKPANILLSAGRDVKITDFGIARSQNSPRLTAKGGVVGTMAYLSPEYLQGQPVDERGDIYAIGVIGYEMLTGKSPFDCDSVYGLVEKKINEDPLPPDTLNPHCPAALSEIVMKAMRRDPNERYRFALHMLRELDELSSRLEQNPNFAPTKPLSLRRGFRTSADSLWRLRPGRLAGGLLVLAAALLGAWIVLREASDVTAPRQTQAITISAVTGEEPLPGEDPKPDLVVQPPLVGAKAPPQRQTMLYRFADFVEWPSHAFLDRKSPLRICLVGNSGFGVEFERMVSQASMSDGRPLWAQRFGGMPSAAILATCQIVYAAGLPKEQVSALLEPLRRMPLLTVTDGTGLGVIDFVSSGGGTSYIVNTTRAAQAEIRLSPVLVDLAVRQPKAK